MEQIQRKGTSAGFFQQVLSLRQNAIILVTSIADPDPGSSAILTPRSRNRERKKSGFGTKKPDHISASLVIFYPGSGWDPGSATLPATIDDPASIPVYRCRIFQILDPDEAV
jgi:hypothetical protein